MKHEEFFRKHPVFTGEEMSRYLASCGKVGPRTKEALLAYYKKTGRVISIRRGLYAVVPPGANPASYPVDPFLVAAKLTKDAVLSYHTALEFHGHAYTVHEHFIYSASRPLSPFTYRSHVFRGVRFPESLRRAGKEDFGVVTMDRSGLEVRVTSLERTLVDVLNRPDLSGGWEEIWRSLESVEFFDLDKVVEYVLLLGNATTAAKVGFFLEQHRESLMVEEKHLKSLHALRPRQPHYLDRDKRKSGRLVSEWNLVVPREVFERTWAEVL
ncbi:MAG: transcriptional regulator [Thermodesulfobacteria bacterium]|nr:transcriptional regulator [Thermodesulfobacteriota bacterium]